MNNIYEPDRIHLKGHAAYPTIIDISRVDDFDAILGKDLSSTF